MQAQKDFGEDGLTTWRNILSRHEPVRKTHIIDLFEKGVLALGINPNKIPDLALVNEKLKKASGFQGVFVDGLEDGTSFFSLLSKRFFPIGNFIRDKRDLSYTPAPDVVHDLYGHLPFLTDPRYADFCQKFGDLACQVASDPNALRQAERFFWFTIEFGLIKTPMGIKVFGAGIASSIGECQYALSAEPEVLPFDIDTIRHQEFRIDQMQKRLFLLDNVEQLYNSLPELFAKIRGDMKA